jgi:hypothetical protein
MRQDAYIEISTNSALQWHEENRVFQRLTLLQQGRDNKFSKALVQPTGPLQRETPKKVTQEMENLEVAYTL